MLNFNKRKQVMQQYTVHLPVRNNNGHLIPIIAIDQILGKALDTFGGYTYDPNRTIGGWIDPNDGKQYVEDMTRLIIASSDDAIVTKFMEYVRDKLAQITVYVHVSGEVRFI